MDQDTCPDCGEDWDGINCYHCGYDAEIDETEEEEPQQEEQLEEE